MARPWGKDVGRVGAGPAQEAEKAPSNLRILGFPVSPLRVTTSSSGREVDGLDVTSQEQLWSPSRGCPPSSRGSGRAGAIFPHRGG